MSTGSSSDSTQPPSEPEPPFSGGHQHPWLASPRRHPVTWALAGLVLLSGGGVALIQHQPDARARAQSAYCGLVTCAVLRSVADSSSAAVLAPRLSLALPSPGAASRAPVHTRAHPPTAARSRSPKPVALSTPTPAPSPKPAPAPTPAPSPTQTPRPPRWPWPPTRPTWPTWPTWPWPGGGGRHGQLTNTWQRGYQPRHARHL